MFSCAVIKHNVWNIRSKVWNSLGRDYTNFQAPKNNYFDPNNGYLNRAVKIPRDNIRWRNIEYNMVDSAKEKARVGRC